VFFDEPPSHNLSPRNPRLDPRLKPIESKNSFPSSPLPSKLSENSKYNPQLANILAM